VAKTKTKNKVKKCIKQHSFDTNSPSFKELLNIANEYNDVRNYIFSSFSGINSLLIIQNSRLYIRDV
jgi:hypothetical protein